MYYHGFSPFFISLETVCSSYIVNARSFSALYCIFQVSFWHLHSTHFIFSSLLSFCVIWITALYLHLLFYYPSLWVTVSKDYEAPKLGVVLCFVVVAHFWWPLLSILYLLAVVVGFRGVLLGYYLFLFWRSSFLLMHHLQWDYPRQHQHCNHCSRAVVLLFSSVIITEKRMLLQLRWYVHRYT